VADENFRTIHTFQLSRFSLLLVLHEQICRAATDRRHVTRERCLNIILCRTQGLRIRFLVTLSLIL